MNRSLTDASTLPASGRSRACSIIWLLCLAAARTYSASASNGIYVEVYQDIPGLAISDLTSAPAFPSSPTSKKVLDGPFEFTWNQDAQTEFGVRIRALVRPPTSGSYVFSISSDDASMLYLSTDDAPENKREIAWVTSWNSRDTWNQEPNQQSSPISLAGDRLYYIEALLKQGHGLYHVAVRWTLPDGTIEQPIAASRLSPYSGPLTSVPIITKQPSDRTVTVNRAAVFSIDVANPTLLDVQWQRNEADIPGATSMDYIVPAATGAMDQARFRCRATNPFGTVYSDAAVLSVAASPPDVHGLLRETFVGKPGDALESAPGFPYFPSSSSIITDGFESPGDLNWSFGQRLRGFFEPPESGSYVFWIASGFSASLYLSTDDTPENKRLIAHVDRFTTAREWFKEEGQRSVPVTLATGRRYYIEAVQSVLGGSYANLSVTWQLPGGLPPEFGSPPIPRDALFVYERLERVAPSISMPPKGQSVVVGEPVTLRIHAIGSVPLAFQWRKDGLPLSNQTNRTISIPAAAPSDAGTYSCSVSNEFGMALSPGAPLTVFSQPGVHRFQKVSLLEGNAFPLRFAVDGSGNAAFSGTVWETTTKFGNIILTNELRNGLYVVNVASAGDVRWIQHGTCTNGARPQGLLADVEGNVYLAGYFDGRASQIGQGDRLRIGSLSLAARGDRDLFLIKFDSEGNAAWVRHVGGWVSTADASGGLAFGADGDVYVSGTYRGRMQFDTLNLERWEGALYVARFSPAGDLKGFTELTEHAYGAWISAIAIDKERNVFVAGTVFGMIRFKNGADILPENGDIFLAKLSPAGSIEWLQQAGSTIGVSAEALACDPEGNCFVAGRFSGTPSKPARFGEFNLITGKGWGDSYIAKYSSSGVCRWVHSVTGGPAVTGVVADPQGAAIVSGNFESQSSAGAYSISSDNSDRDMYVAKYDPAGSVQWVQRAGGDFADWLAGISLDAEGNVVIGGILGGPDYQQAQFGSITFGKRTSPSLFVAKLTASTTGLPNITSQPQDMQADTGESITFTIRVSGAAPFQYEWLFNDAPVPGQTNATFTISSVQSNDAGKYRVRITNAEGSVLSDTAVLSVNSTPMWRVTTLAGNGSAGLVDAADGLQAQFNQPNSPAISKGGVIFVPEGANHVIRFITREGAVGTWAGQPQAGFLDAPASTALFNSPLAVCIDRNGDLLVADAGNDRIRKIVSVGLRSVVTVAGNGVRGYRDGPAAEAQFNFPNDLVQDSSGNIYVIEFNNHTVRRISVTGQVSTFAGNGQPGSVDGKGTAARFNQPAGIAIDSPGNLYVTEWSAHRVRKIFPDGTVTTLAGTGSAGFNDGAATVATLNIPDAIVADASGAVFITEQGNHAIRRIDANGFVTTIAGKGTAGFADGDKTQALFNRPGGIALHPDGSLIVADTIGNRIRRVSLGSETNLPPADGFLVLELNPALQLYGTIGQVYRIDYADAATPANWIALTNLTIRTVPERWTDPRPAHGSKRFYRAIRQ